MGDRLSKSSVLSDPQIIDLINREFIAIDLNVSDVGFPDWMTGLNFWKQTYIDLPRARFAFANQAVVDSSGEYLLASGDIGLMPRDPSTNFSINYDPPRYLAMLQTAVERNKRLEAARADAALSPEQRKAAMAAVSKEAHDLLPSLFPVDGPQSKGRFLPTAGAVPPPSPTKASNTAAKSK